MQHSVVMLRAASWPGLIVLVPCLSLSLSSLLRTSSLSVHGVARDKEVGRSRGVLEGFLEFCQLSK